MVSTGKMLAFINALGGGSAAPSEVVILPETVLTVDDGQARITVPLQAPVADGDTVSISYNGTEYECTGAFMEGMGVAFGNLAALGEMYTGNPDAPFVVILAPDGFDEDNDGNVDFYGSCMPIDGSSTTITLSIVQVGAESGGGSASAGSGFIVKATVTLDGSGGSGTATFDKTMDETVAAIKAGQYVVCHNDDPEGGMILPAVTYAAGNMVMFCVYVAGMTHVITMLPDGTGMYQFS